MIMHVNIYASLIKNYNCLEKWYLRVLDAQQHKVKRSIFTISKEAQQLSCYSLDYET